MVYATMQPLIEQLRVRLEEARAGLQERHPQIQLRVADYRPGSSQHASHHIFLEALFPDDAPDQHDGVALMISFMRLATAPMLTAHVNWGDASLEAHWHGGSVPWSLAAGSQLLADLPELLQVFAAAVERGYPSREIRPLADGEELALEVAGGQWLATWHPPEAAPEGQPHGACGVCVAEGGQVVLISADGQNWDLPAGRTEDEESWEETLRREVQEEACATVVQARLLGFAQSRCLSGPQAGLVLVRSFWRAEVTLDPWLPQFEITHRQLVEPGALAPLLPPLYARILARALIEAGV